MNICLAEKYNALTGLRGVFINIAWSFIKKTETREQYINSISKKLEGQFKLISEANFQNNQCDIVLSGCISF